ERTQVILAGVETHVCVYQTALDLVGAGMSVTIVADAVSSRTAENKAIALTRLMSENVKLSSTEMVLFELTVTSGTDEFRAISKLVK
ncbi:MAG: isochorismatase family protein, partial [Acidobacteriota bacterium]|nr:isochorismatase family protein [Acidobacteriota bacterium]